MLARQNERQKNIILQGEGIKQVEILKNKPEVLAAERSNLFFSDGNVTFVSACTRLPPNRVVYTFFNPLTSKTAINKSPFSIR